MHEQQTAELNKIFQSYRVRGTGVDVVEHMDVNGDYSCQPALL